jgi:hypothetical protein
MRAYVVRPGKRGPSRAALRDLFQLGASVRIDFRADRDLDHPRLLPGHDFLPSPILMGKLGTRATSVNCKSLQFHSLKSLEFQTNSTQAWPCLLVSGAGRRGIAGSKALGSADRGFDQQWPLGLAVAASLTHLLRRERG